jgi:hypothetical protein
MPTYLRIVFNVFWNRRHLLTSSYSLVDNNLAFAVSSGKLMKWKRVTNCPVSHLQKVILHKIITPRDSGYSLINDINSNTKTETVSVNIYNFNLIIVFQIFTQFCDIHIHTSTIKVGIAAPNFLQRMFNGVINRPNVRLIISATRFPWEKRVCIFPLWLSSRNFGLKTTRTIGILIFLLVNFLRFKIALFSVTILRRAWWYIIAPTYIWWYLPSWF